MHKVRPEESRSRTESSQEKPSLGTHPTPTMQARQPRKVMRKHVYPAASSIHLPYLPYLPHLRIFPYH